MRKLLVGIAAAFYVPFAFAATGTELLQKFINEVKTAQGTFEQTVVDKQGKQVDASAGEFAFSRPGKFVWKYEKPYPQEIICDGKQMWMWDKDLNQVTIRQAAKALPQSPAAILFGQTKLDKDWSVKELGEKDGFQWVELKPKEEEIGFSSIMFGFRGKVPERMEFVGNLGEISKIRLNDVTTGSKFNSKDFTFTPPKGADVVEME